MKRIVGIISFMNRGGAQEAMLRLMRQLRLRGYDTDVWFLYPREHCYGNEEHVRLLCPHRRLTTWTYLALFFQVWRDLRRTRADAVIGFLSLGNALGLTAAAAAGVRTRLAAQRTPSFAVSPLMRRVDRLLGSLPIYKAIICVSDQVRQSFGDNPARYRAKLSVVPNGIEWHPSTLDKQAARSAFGLPTNAFLCVATGRFVREKNYPFLVEVARRVPGAHFAIGGNGPLLPAVREAAAQAGVGDRFYFLGQLERGQIPNLLRAADAFVHASLFEGHSNSILEAMHEGLPVVANDIDTIRESVIDEVGEPTTLLCPVNDAENWAKALVLLRDDRAAGEALARRALALVDRRFTLTAMVDAFESLLLSLESRSTQTAWKGAAAS